MIMIPNQSIKVLIIFFLVMLTPFVTFSQAIDPVMKIKTSGPITDFVLDGSTVLLSTAAGTIESYNLINGKKIEIIELPPSKDFMGNPVPTKVYSIDRLNDLTLYVTQGSHGFRNVELLDADFKIHLFDAEKERLMVKKARFINNELILLGLLGNELILYDLVKNETVYKTSISPYSFSDFDLNDDKSYVFTADESGVIHKMDVDKGNWLEDYSGNNVDNVFKLVASNETIITAGQDRRVGFYSLTGKQHHFLQKEFLVYCVGLSTDGKIAAYTADEENTIFLFDLEKKNETHKLKGHKGIVSKIEILNKSRVISSSEDGYLLIWDLN